MKNTTQNSILKAEQASNINSTEEPIPPHILRHVVHQQQLIDSKNGLQSNIAISPHLKQNSNDTPSPQIDYSGNSVYETRINFGYYSHPITESASGLSFKQLKKVTRQLVNSPQYTANANNQQLHKTRQDLFNGENAQESSKLSGIARNELEMVNTPLPPPLSLSLEPQRSNLLNNSPSINFSTNLEDLRSRKIESILHLLPEQNTVVLNENESVSVFLQLLDKHDLRSCVIQHDSITRLCFPRSSFSFADVRDFLYYIILMHKSWNNRSFTEIVAMIKEEKIGRIANISKKSPFVRYDVTDTIASLCAAFKPCCRVPIFDKKRLVRVLSPADMLFILNKSDTIKEIENYSSISIKNASKGSIVKLMQSESLLKAMILMERFKFSALPIVSDRDINSVLEVITVREIKYIYLAQDELQSEVIINEPAFKFVSFLRRKGYLKAEAYARLPETASLQEIIDIFLADMVKNTQSVHRVFLLDDNGRMTGMISLTDIMQNLAELLGKFTRVPSESQLPNSHPAHNRN